MSSDDRKLEEALRAVGDDYVRRNPADLHRARARIRKLRRRRQMKAGALGTLGAAAALAVAVYAWPGAETASEGPRPAAPVPAEATIPVGEGPSEVAVGHGTVWVASTADQSITRIDPETNEVQATIQLEAEPGDLAVDLAGNLWVALPDAGVVQRIDGRTNGLTPNMRVPVATPGTPLDLAVDLYLWVSAVDVELVQVDFESGEVVGRNDDLRPVNVAARHGGVFVLEGDGTVSPVDPETGAAASWERAFEFSGRGDVHFYGGRLWVAEGNGSELFSLPMDGSDELESYAFRGTYTEMVHGPEGVLVLSDVGDGIGVLTLIDPSGGGTRELAEVGGRPRDLVRGAEDLWVTNSADATVTRLTGIL